MSTRKELTPPEEVKYGRGKYLGGSRLEDIFDVLRTGEYAFGGLLARFKELKAENELRQARGERLDPFTTVKQTADIMFAGPVHGIRHRISPSAVFEVEGFWAEMATDIAFDPTTYTPLGLWKTAKAGYAAIPKVATRLGMGTPVTRAGEILGEAFVPGYRIKQLGGRYKEYFGEYLDWVLRKRGAEAQAFHELKQMAKPFRKSGEAITRYIEGGTLTGNKALDKYVNEVILTSRFAHKTGGRISHELTKKGRLYVDELEADAQRYLHTKTIEAVNREAGFNVFEPDFWKAAAISKRKYLHDEYVNQWFKYTDDLLAAPKTGAGKLQDRKVVANALHELKQMAEPFKKSGRAITRYIESGTTTGNKALDKYIDDTIRPHLAEMRKIEIEHGIDVEKLTRYVPHELTTKGREYAGWLRTQKKLPQIPHPYAQRRGRRGTIEAINKEVGFEFFEPDFWKAMIVRTEKHTQDVYRADRFAYITKKYGGDLPAPIARHLEDMVTPSTAGPGKLYDWALAWWKRSVTVGFALLIHPAFFVRNVYSGIYQNWQRTGMWNPMDYYLGIQARLGRGTFKTAERGKITGKEMQDILREQSIMGQPGMTDIIHETIWERTIWQKVRDTPAWFMTESENLVRIPEFVRLTRQMSLKEARDITYQTHFAYLPEFHTKFEMKVMKRLFPFYTWMSRNIPFTIQRTLEQPGKLAGVGRLQQKLIKHYGMEEEYERRTGWQRNMFLIPNVFRGGRGWIGIGLPFTDLTMDLEDMYFSVSPIKLIPELGYMQSGWEMDWPSKERKRKKQKEAVMRVLEGRYGTTAKRLARTRDPVDKLMYLAAMPTYRAASKDIAAFDAARWRDPRPSKPQQYAAWVAAGQPEDFRTRSLPDDTLLALTAEEYEVSQGFQPTEEQLQDILTGPAGREERYRRLVAEWNAFRTSEARLEYPSREQRIESWRQAGKPRKYTQRVYRDDGGKLLGTLTLTPADVRMLGTFRLSEAQKVWMFRETRKMKPLAQVMIWIEEHAAEMSQRQEMREELTELYRGVRATKGTDIPDALRAGGGDARRRRRWELEEALRIGVDS